MSMKKILMTAVAVSALSAGAASAATISVSSSIGGVGLSNGAGTPAIEPFTIASEVDTPGTGTGIFVISPDSTIAAGTYKVIWNISGGTFGTVTSVAGTQQAAPGTAQSCTVSTPSATSIIAVCISTGSVLTTDTFTLTVPVVTGIAKSPVVVSGSITTQADVAVDGGAIAPVTVIDYRAGLKTVAANAYKGILNLDPTNGNFKKISGTGIGAQAFTGINNWAIGSGVGFALNTAVAAAGADLVYDKFNAGAAVPLTAANAIAAVTATVNGTLGVLKPVFATAYTGGNGAAVDYIFTTGQSPATGSATALINATHAAAFIGGTGIVGLAQVAATPVANSESAYSITLAPTMNTGYTAGSYSTKTLGSLAYQGTTFQAAWVGDGLNGIGYQIRVSSASAIPFVQVNLSNPATTGTSGTVASTASCPVGSVAAKGELIITSAMLNSCFGAFKRGDITVNIGTAANPANVSAKMRTTAVNGTTTELSLGNGTAAAATIYN